jgi:hypothetical protein
MGGGAGITFKFWFESVDLTYHPYARLDTGVLTAKAQPRLIKFNARGYEDGMDCVRGDLWTVSDFSVVVPAETREELAEYMAYHRKGAGYTYPHPLVAWGGRARGEPDYGEMIWRGWRRGDIAGVVFGPGGDVDIDIVNSPAVTWSCRLTATPQLSNWYAAVFDWIPEEPDDWNAGENGEWDESDEVDIHWEGVRFCYGYTEPKGVQA